MDKIVQSLAKALLLDGPLAWALFEVDLEEQIGDYLESKQADGDHYLFAITEHMGDVAMTLIDHADYVHVNENARTQLQQLWPDTYTENMRLLIPQIATQLAEGYLFHAGVKVAE